MTASGRRGAGRGAGPVLANRGHRPRDGQHNAAAACITVAASAVAVPEACLTRGPVAISKGGDLEAGQCGSHRAAPDNRPWVVARTQRLVICHSWRCCRSGAGGRRRGCKWNGGWNEGLTRRYTEQCS